MKGSDDQTIKKFREIIRRFERAIFVQNSESCCGGVTLAQCHTLLEIKSKNQDTVTELAKSLCLDKSTVSRTIDGLVNIGLVDRSVPTENRRIATLKLTDAGQKICKSINCTNDSYFSEIMSILTTKEKEDFVGLLERITDRMIQLRTTCSSLNQD